MTWLLPIVAVCIKMGSRGPVFFRQRRLGLYGKTFQCLKFRTMIPNPEADEKPARHNDERITAIGRILRKTNIDELPQLFNVLAGQMSITGPRPHMLSDCIRFSFVVGNYNARHIIKPGITGLAQIKGYHGPANDHHSIVSRFYWDDHYIRHASLLLDLKIMAYSCMLPVRTLRRKLQNLCFRQRPAVRGRPPGAGNDPGTVPSSK
jgi:putative colanic acid biosynthesis UDP-glucose lipid carrier transferase